MKKIIISSVFVIINFIVFGQMHNNFGGPSTTYQMQQNAQRMTQNNNFQRQQFDQQQRSLRDQQQRSQMRLDPNRSSSRNLERRDRPKKQRLTRKERKEKKAQARVNKEPVEEKK